MRPAIKLAHLAAPIVNFLEQATNSSLFGDEASEPENNLLKSHWGPPEYQLVIGLDLDTRASNGLGYAFAAYRFNDRGSEAAIKARRDPGADGWVVEYDFLGHDRNGPSVSSWLVITNRLGREFKLVALDADKGKYFIATDAEVYMYLRRTSELFLEQIAKRRSSGCPGEE